MILHSYCMFHECAIDWNLLCAIFQKTSSEDLSCSLQNCCDVYSAFLSNVEEFRKLCWSMLTVVIRGLLNPSHSNKAFWHKQCNVTRNSTIQMLYIYVHLERKKKSTEIESTDSTSRPKVYFSVCESSCMLKGCKDRDSL